MVFIFRLGWDDVSVKTASLEFVMKTVSLGLHSDAYHKLSLEHTTTRFPSEFLCR